MESITVHVDKENSVMLSCPSCGISKMVSLDKFKDLKQKFSVRCKCNNCYEVHLDFRKSYRKNVTLPGEFKVLSPMVSIWMDVIVCDISRTGIGFNLIEPFSIKKGSTIQIKFNLDNSKQTLIDKKGIVRVVKKDFIGCDFSDFDLYEKELGFYLMP